MILKVVYDDDSQILVDNLKSVLPNYPLIELESYNESLFKERKKAFKIKGSFSARHTPFAVLINDNLEPVMAFYSEANTCTVDEILKTLNNYTVYGRKE